jgi:hypothetical protein
MVRLVLGNAAGGAARILSAEPLAGLAAELGGGWSGDGLNGAREDERSSDLDDGGAELHCGCKVELYHELVVDRTAFGRKEGGVLYVQRCFYLFYFIFFVQSLSSTIWIEIRTASCSIRPPNCTIGRANVPRFLWPALELRIRIRT